MDNGEPIVPADAEEFEDDELDEEEEEEDDDDEWAGAEDLEFYEDELVGWGGMLGLVDSDDDLMSEDTEDGSDLGSFGDCAEANHFSSNMPDTGLGPCFTIARQPSQYQIFTQRHHHQVADALVCRPEPDDTDTGAAGTEVLLLGSTQGRRGSRVTLVRTGAADMSGPDDLDRVLPAPDVLGEEGLPFSPYSMARSTCGKHFAVCGSGSSLALFSYMEASGGAPSKLSLAAVGLIIGIELPGMNLMQGLMASSGNMNNSIRFGKLWGEERMIISCQVGSQVHMLENQEKPNYAYILNVPSPSKPGRPAQQIPCLPPTPPVDCAASALGAWCHSVEGSSFIRVTTKPIIPDLRDDALGDGDQGLDTRTAVLGPFPADLNCVNVSPDGQWVAAVADTLELYLVQLGGQQAWAVQKCLTVPLQTSAERAVPNIQTENNQSSGSQYVAWNRTGTMVAATTDLTGRIFVYDINKRQLVGACHHKHHQRPCMALSWSPFHDNILAYAEDCSRVHVMDVRGGTPEDPWQKCECLSPPSMRGDGQPSRDEIHGLGWGGSAAVPEVFAATSRRVLKWPVVGNCWTTARHSTYPPLLKDSVVALLKYSLTDRLTGEPRHPTGQPHGFWSLPREVLLTIIKLTAESAAEDWVA